MNLKLLLLTLMGCYCFIVSGQNTTSEFGKLNAFERSFVSYDKDTTANAVVLFEKGNDHFEVVNNRIQVIKKYHIKIKILDSEGYDQATISIPYYKGDQAHEKVQRIKAVTHNGEVKHWVQEAKIFNKDVNKYWSERTFTFPAVEEGSIIEYQYELLSPFFFNLTGWTFQSEIPKVYSEYYAEIPGNYTYNRSLVGALKLDVNESSLKKRCFFLPGTASDADCEVVRYAIKDIPAFKEEEEYMLAASNYISKIEFEMSEHQSVRGGVKKFTKSWKDVDREFKADRDIGRQLSKKSFFEKSAPAELFTEMDTLTKAKKVYDFIQSHFSWNKKFSIHNDSRVKSAFENQVGSVGEINLSLVNLLNASGLKADIVLMSTRKNGLPKKSHPVMSDFNYLIAKIDIDGTSYLLDATDKEMPFGILPYRCLNYYGRVMDFKKGSYWINILPEKDNSRTMRGRINIDRENQLITGEFNSIETGYYAISKYKVLEKVTEDSYLSEIEESLSDSEEVSVAEYSQNEKNSDEKKISERFKFEWEGSFDSDILYINPFMVRYFKNNPFVLEERNYPIDFGHPRKFKYQVAIQIPEGYKVASLPEKKVIALADKSGDLQFLCTAQEQYISVFFNLGLKKAHYSPDHYEALKELFRIAVDVQKNSLISLEKI